MERLPRTAAPPGKLNKVSGTASFAGQNADPGSPGEDRLWAKRIFDLGLCIVVLPFVVPVATLIALAIRYDSPGPAFFRQRRIGWKSQPFTIFKFRTLSSDFNPEIGKDFMVKLVRGEIAPESKPRTFKPDHSAYQTRVGTFLRKTSLDELPQILNILRGEMSWVGPRPHVPFEVAEYRDWQRQRLGVLPGITGLAQVKGRSDLPFEQLVSYDLEYVQNGCFWLDLKIMWWTLLAVVKRKGAG